MVSFLIVKLIKIWVTDTARIVILKYILEDCESEISHSRFMFQTNNVTHYTRSIQRIVMNHCYPVATNPPTNPSVNSNHLANFPSHQWSSSAGLRTNGAALNTVSVNKS